MNPFDTSMDEKIHRHLELEKNDTILTISVFDTPSIDALEVDISRVDKEGKLTFNSYKMFLSEEEFKQLADFLGDIRRTVSIRNSHKSVEDFRLDFIAEEEKQIDFIQVDDDHVDLNKPNLFRDIIDSQRIKNKMRASKDYCKRFYAAMCNTDLYKVGSTGEYGYSWRSAGGLVADILGEGDYLDWYCSGNEGFVDDEIADDLNEVGWVAVPMEVQDYDSSQDKLL
jgi:hypothetical protein